MKKTIYTFFFCLYSLTLIVASNGIKEGIIKVIPFKNNSQIGFENLQLNAKSNIEIVWNDNYAIPSFLTGNLTSPGFVHEQTMQRDIFSYLSANKELFGIVNPDKELELLSSYKDELGQTHAKFQQKINNVKYLKDN